ncbi:MAG: phosphoribosylamine--glycine ligase [Fimbriimonadaceae bacterium]|nr:phosphoribosylamine--glycine ligase [Fimbriimonadaceae bacterium]
MRILVIGSGGREHALVWKLAQEAEVFAAPGNPGIAQICECFPVSPTDHKAVIDLAVKLTVDFVLVGPENPLIDGLGSSLIESGIPVVGPNPDGAQLEGSKAFSKELMADAHIPTAEFQIFTHPEPAKDYVKTMFDAGRQVAVKVSGLALGKGVTVCSTLEEATEAIDAAMVEKVFGDAGHTLVIEERLTGREFSLLTLCSGTHFRSLPVAQDYKRIFDGDRGPNTGGMGTFSPVPWITDDIVRQTEAAVVAPLLNMLKDRGIDYRGVLFSGLMFDGMKIKCLEYNVRFGDPETQSVMKRLGSGFAAALYAVAKGEPIPAFQVKPNAVVTVVLASANYPAAPQTSFPITLPETIPDGLNIFHAGTKIVDGTLTNSGGRVLAVSAEAPDLGQARETAYDVAKQIAFEGVQYRTDIASI